MQQQLLKVFTLSFLLLIGAQAVAQNRVLKGVIRDENGSPVTKASVIVKGTSNGTTSSEDGSFQITVAPNSILVISAVGFENQEVSTSGADNITINLKKTDETLNEVVVTALGVKREKRNLTFSSQELKADELVRAKEPNLLNALTGKVSGVQITSSSGTPGASSRIVIRGATSISGNNQALIVVDGIPINNSETGSVNSGPGSNRLMDIDPSIIESINVLKGASATALYGSAGARGVVMITTKNGAASKKPLITVSSDLSFENGIFPELQDKYALGDRKVIGGVTYNNQYFDGDIEKSSSSWGPLIDTLFYNGEKVQKRNPLKDFFQTGITTNNTISFSGVNGAGSNYYASYSYLDQKGIVPTTYLKRHSLFTKFQTKLTEKLTGTFQFNYSNSKTNRMPEGYILESPIWTVYTSPISFNPLPYLYPDGTQRVFRFSRNSPYWVLDNIYTHGNVNRFLPTITLTYEPLSWLTITERMGADIYSEQVKYYEARGSVANPNGVVVDRTNNFRQFNHDLIINARKEFNKFNAELLLGNNVLSSYYQGVEGRGVGLSITEGFDNVSNASTQTYSESHSLVRKVGFYAQATIEYNRLLNLALTGRYDGSSVLSRDKSFYPYGSVAAGFIFSELIQSSFLDFGKLRVSYATVGNDNVGAYSLNTPYVNSTISGINFPFQGQNGFLLTSGLGNSLLQNETVKEFEIGLEFKVLRNRLGAEISYFDKKVEDGIIPVSIAPSTGYTSTTINTAEMQTKGIEILLNGSPVQTSRFNWDVIFNFTKLNNKVLALYEGLESVSVGFTQAIVGEPYGEKFGTRFARNDNGDLLIGADGLPFAASTQGKLGSIQPDWLAGITNNLSYGPFSLSFFFDMRKGGVIENNVDGYGYFYGTPKITENRGPRVVEGISVVDDKPNEVVVESQDYFRRLNSILEAVIQDATYLKLRNVSLSYSIQQKVLGKTPFKSAVLTITGRNLWIHSPHFTGGDPEVSSFGSSNGSQGLYSFSTPTPRSVNVSLKFSF